MCVALNIALQKWSPGAEPTSIVWEIPHSSYNQESCWMLEELYDTLNFQRAHRGSCFYQFWIFTKLPSLGPAFIALCWNAAEPGMGLIEVLYHLPLEKPSKTTYYPQNKNLKVLTSAISVMQRWYLEVSGHSLHLEAFNKMYCCPTYSSHI